MLSALLALLISPAAAQPPAVSSAPAAAYVPAVKFVSESDAPRFEESFKSKTGLIKAARKAIKYLETLPPTRTLRVADRDYGPAQFIDSAKTIIELAQKSKSAGEFDSKVRADFDVFQSSGLDGKGRVVFSSYYQPMLRASPRKTAAYPYPLYRRPKDMVEVDLAAFGRANGETSLLGRVTKDGKVVPYYTREDIDRRKALAGKGLELVWLKDRFDALDLHIQGSAILKFPDGKEKLAKYAGSNSRNYNSVGLTLVKAGVFARDEITHDKLRQYLRDNPDAESWIIAQNPRYVFFDLAPLPEDGEPFGAAEQSLVPARSIAIDPAFLPLGGLYFFTTTSPQTDKDGRLLGMSENSRFAFGLDTGGAIKSPGRVDIYAGHGPQAAATARGQWADGKLYLLVKKLPARALMALQDALDRADELGAAGRYFDAHEELEAFWMKASGDEKILLQGLIQIAAGLHRLKLDPKKTDGAFYLLERGAQKLAKAKSLLVPETLASLDAALRTIRASGQAPASLTFGLKGAAR